MIKRRLMEKCPLRNIPAWTVCMKVNLIAAPQWSPLFHHQAEWKGRSPLYPIDPSRGTTRHPLTHRVLAIIIIHCHATAYLSLTNSQEDRDLPEPLISIIIIQEEASPVLGVKIYFPFLCPRMWPLLPIIYILWYWYYLAAPPAATSNCHSL